MPKTQQQHKVVSTECALVFCVTSRNDLWRLTSQWMLIASREPHSAEEGDDCAATHHTAPRAQRRSRAGEEGHEEKYIAPRRQQSLLRKRSSSCTTRKTPRGYDYSWYGYGSTCTTVPGMTTNSGTHQDLFPGQGSTAFGGADHHGQSFVRGQSSTGLRRVDFAVPPGFPAGQGSAAVGGADHRGQCAFSQSSSPASVRVTWVDGDDVWVRMDTAHGQYWKKLLSNHWQWYRP